MNITIHRRAALRGLSACALFLCCACSDDGPAPREAQPCSGAGCLTDAGAADAGSVNATEAAVAAQVADAAALAPWVVLEEAGVTGGPLEVALSVSGAERTCGACAVVTARVLGGKPPYAFAWNDSALSGPGPHEVCDKESKTYEVTVSDSTLAGPDDPTPAAMKRSASALLACSESKPQNESELTGCKLLLDASILSGLNPGGLYVERVYGCHDFNGGPGVSSAIVTDPDAGPMPMYQGQGFDIPETLKAGKTYQLTFELLLPFTLGGDVRMELYGSREGCSLDEKLTDVKWEGIARQSWCITPKQDIKKLLVKPVDGGEPPLFSISFGVSATMCSGCASN